MRIIPAVAVEAAVLQLAGQNMAAEAGLHSGQVGEHLGRCHSEGLAESARLGGHQVDVGEPSCVGQHLVRAGGTSWPDDNAREADQEVGVAEWCTLMGLSAQSLMAGFRALR